MMCTGFSLVPASAGGAAAAGAAGRTGSGSAGAWGFAGGLGARTAPSRTGYIFACHNVSWTCGMGGMQELVLRREGDDCTMYHAPIYDVRCTNVPM